MSKEDVSKVKIDNYSVGIMGLNSILKEIASEYSERSDGEIATELLNRVIEKNYIPDSAKESYRKVLFKEFQKFLGQSTGADDSRVELVIKVLGQGCVQCDQLQMDVMDVLNEMSIAADLEHVKDLKEIGQYGVMGMPALLINGRVVSVGKVPPKRKIKEWLVKEL